MTHTELALVLPIALVLPDELCICWGSKTTAQATQILVIVLQHRQFTSKTLLKMSVAILQMLAVIMAL